MSDQLGLTEAVSIALGGMIGGGIYAVLGVVAGIVGPATWASFVLAGMVALCAGYSFATLNAIDDEHRGGAVSFVERFLGNATVAGMTGWTLLVGYVGSMAMYAFAFGEFAVDLPGIPVAIAGVPLRPLVSVGAVGAFLGLNLLGARATGAAENVLVGVKLAILLAFGIGGLAFLLGWSPEPVSLGVTSLSVSGPVIAAAVSFVAFQGWQLLFYDQERIADPLTTLPRAVYGAIAVAVAVYVLVAVTTVSLAPAALETHPHVALARAAEHLTAPLGAGAAGGLVISVSALVSTGSAINATLFSSGHFARHLLAEDLLPDRLGTAHGDGIPPQTLLVLGGITAVLTALGTLGAITAFASLAFILVFGGVCLLAFRQRADDRVHPVPPGLGAVGSLGFFVLMIVHLYRAEPGTFGTVVVLAVVIVAVEVLYFEREGVLAAVDALERDVEQLR